MIKNYVKYCSKLCSATFIWNLYLNLFSLFRIRSIKIKFLDQMSFFPRGWGKGVKGYGKGGRGYGEGGITSFLK